MATAVLMEFKSRKAAEAFVEKVNGSYGTPSFEAQERGRVVTGVWKLPTNFCQCVGTEKMKMRAFARGKKYGWWVHTQCGLPSKYWGIAAPRLWQALGRNILPGVEDDGEPNMYKGHARDHDNTMVSDLQEVGMDIDMDHRREKRRRNRPRRES